MTFRQKIFFGYLAVFCLFLAILSSAANYIVQKVVEQAMENRAIELIAKIRTAANDEELVKRLQALKPLIFFRVSVITDRRRTLYDSHTEKILGELFSSEYEVEHPEVEQAFGKGSGYVEAYSAILSQKFAYTAIAFDFHGHTYVMRTAFPYRYVKELVDDFEAGFFMLAALVLLLFSAFTWFIMYRLTRPMQQIISAVADSSTEEAMQVLKEVAKKGPEDVAKLAHTLFSLSERIEKQIISLQEVRREREVLLESMIEGVIFVDEELVVRFANDSAKKMVQRPQMVGAPFSSLQLPQVEALVKSCQAKNSPVEGAIKKDNQSFDFVITPIHEGRGTLLVLQDQSDRYRLLEMRKDFIANASHELKTPITIIHGFAETLHDNPQMAPKTVQEITGTILRNCARMTTLIHDLLALADMEELSPLRLQECDIGALVDKILQQTRCLDPAAELIHTGDKELYLLADAHLLEMALDNLVQNAIKYSSSPAKVQVDIRKEQDQAVIRVIDQGIGIPLDEQEHIFERFYRSKRDRAHKVSGSGLGLSIVQAAIWKHSGTIHLKSVEGQGSCFTLSLPIKKV